MNTEYRRKGLWRYAGLLLGILQALMLLAAIGCSDILWICILGTIQIVLNIITVCISARCLLSVSMLFISFSYILHLGQYTLQLLNTNVVPTANIFQKASESLLIRSGQYVITAQAFICVGIMVYHYLLSAVHVRRKNKWYSIDGVNSAALKYVGAVLFVAGIIPSIIIHLNKIKLMMEGGYYNTFSYSAETGGIRFFISNLWQIGILLWMMVYQGRLWKCRFLYIGSVGYLMLTMLSGSRMTALMYIVMFTLFYLKVIEPLNFKKAVLFLCIGIWAASYIVQIGLTRSGGTGGINGLQDVFAKVLAEFGGTIYSVTLIMEHIPHDVSFAYGSTYLLSPIYVFPNFGQWPEGILAITRFVDYIKGFTSSGLGGTYIGEMFYNFGHAGGVFFFLTGLFLAWLDWKINDAISRKDWLCLTICMGVLPYVFMWTRSFFKDMIRPLVWQAILLLFLYRIFIRNKHH